MDKNKILNASEFLQLDIPPVILGAFFRNSIFSKDSKYICAYFAFKSSKFGSELSEKDYLDYINRINMHSGKYKNWQINDGSIQWLRKGISGCFILLNDKNYTLNESDTFQNFEKLVIMKVQKQSWLYENGLNEDKKDFFRGYFDTVSSFDGSNYMAMDYYCTSKTEINKLEIFLENEIIPLEFANFNVRLTENTKSKNEQFRLNVKYYYSQIGTFNKYKFDSIKYAHHSFVEITTREDNGVLFHDIKPPEHSEKRATEQFNKFYVTYCNFLNIAYGYRIDENNDEKNLEEYRKRFGFDEVSAEEKDNYRCAKNKSLVLEQEDDVCICCKDQYDIKDRSFLQLRMKNGKQEERYFFEIHHAISIASGKDKEEKELLDKIENLGKLCPTCHRCLTKKSGRKKDIYKLLNNMLKNSEKIRNFAEVFFETNDREIIIEKIYERLK